MKLKTFILALLLLQISPKLFSQYNYIIDSTAFSALGLDGGDVGTRVFDINQDGHLDILSIGDHGSPNVNTNQHGITVWFGSGLYNNWTLYQNGDFGYGGISAGDLNNDGIPDVAYGMHHNYSSTDFGDQLLEAALGDGTGMNWTPWDDSLGTAGETYGMFDTDMGDIDNDGWLDIGSTSFGCCAGYHVYKNLETGVWQHAYGYTGGNASQEFLFGDMNGDGMLDFVTTHENGTPFFGDGNGGFTNMHLNLPVQPVLGYAHIALGDVDGDGADDFCFSMNDGIYVYHYDISNNQWINLSATLPTTGYYSGIKLYDMNEDGYLDVVGITGNNLTVWEGDGGTSWTPAFSMAVSNISQTRDIIVADVTHDGRPEIMLWSQYPLSWITNGTKFYMLHDTTVADRFFINPVAPITQACYPAGSVRFIKWTSAVPSNHPSSVALEYSYSGPNGPWNSIAGALPDNGSFQWTVPIITSGDCYIRYLLTDSITLLTDTAITPGPFSIGCGIDTRVDASVAETKNFEVFPNPAGNYFFCTIDLKTSTQTSIRIHNSFGAIVYSSTQSLPAGKNQFRVPLIAFPPGVYHVSLQTMEDVFVKKLVVK